MGRNLSKVFSAELDGINAKLIEVEVDINVGLHAFNIVGLADKALSESKERISSALKNSGIKPPTRENRKITVNLAPADIKKTGSQYDFAIAVGYLLATEQIRPFDTKRRLFAGELSLDGSLRPISGALNIACLAKDRKYETVFLPTANAPEAALIEGVSIIPIDTISQFIDHIEGRATISPQPHSTIPSSKPESLVDIGSIKGQENAKRALMIAASGGHNLLMVGPPGSGKTMLAQSLTSILPPLNEEELIEINQIYSAASMIHGNSFINWRPFRNPHHTASLIAIVGGGQTPRPGEISLAHRGVLFLDELPEFRRDLLEGLRQPLESGVVHISRAKQTLTFPSKFTLVAAMNPCPCGFFRDPEKECTCTMYEVIKYNKKISGPLLDRIDMQIEVPRIKVGTLRKTESFYDTAGKINKKISDARSFQQERFKKVRKKIHTNSEMTSKQCEEFIEIDPSSENFLKTVVDRALISARGYYRILKTARTIADIEQSPMVTEDHLAEAFSYRLRERE